MIVEIKLVLKHNINLTIKFKIDKRIIIALIMLVINKLWEIIF